MSFSNDDLPQPILLDNQEQTHSLERIPFGEQEFDEAFEVVRRFIANVEAANVDE